MAIGMALRYLAPRFSEGLADVLAKIGGILLIVSVLPILVALLPTCGLLLGKGMILAFMVLYRRWSHRRVFPRRARA